MELQEHPHELSVGLEEGPHLVEDDVVVGLPYLPDLPALLAHPQKLGLLGVLRFDLLLAYLFLQSHDEVLDGAGNEVVGAHYLLEGLGEPPVELEEVEYFFLGGLAHFVDEHGLGHHQAAGFDLPELHLLQAGVLIDVEVALYFLYDRPLESIPLDFLHRNVPHKGVDHPPLELLRRYAVEDVLVGHVLLADGQELLQVDGAVGKQQLVELLSAGDPQLLEVADEVPLELLVDLAAPVVLLVPLEGLQELL